MTPNTAAIKVVLVLAVVAAGASLKISRYASAHAAIPTDTADTIARIMATHGWSLVSQSEATTATLYDHLGFRKTGCEKTVTIAAMGGNAEAAEFFRQRYGGDAAFIQGGDVVERPSGVHRQFAMLKQRARTVLGLQTSPMAPILAISPAPPTAQSDCHGPPASVWRRADASQVNTSSIANMAEQSAELRR